MSHTVGKKFNHVSELTVNIRNISSSFSQLSLWNGEFKCIQNKTFFEFHWDRRFFSLAAVIILIIITLYSMRYLELYSITDLGVN